MVLVGPVCGHAVSQVQRCIRVCFTRGLRAQRYVKKREAGVVVFVLKPFLLAHIDFQYKTMFCDLTDSFSKRGDVSVFLKLLKCFTKTTGLPF